MANISVKCHPNISEKRCHTATNKNCGYVSR